MGYIPGRITILDDKQTKKQLEEPEHDESVMPGSIPISMYPEEAGYLFTQSNQEDSEDSIYGDNDEEGVFSFNGSGYEINKRKNGDYNALYDTFIIKNGFVQFRTKLIGEAPLYIIILEGTDIKFRDTSTLEVYKYFKIIEN